MEDPAPATNGNDISDEELPPLPPSTGTSLAALDADADRDIVGQDQEKNDDAVSVKTDDLFSEKAPSSNGSRSNQREPGLNVIEPWGWSGSAYDDYDVVTVHGIRDDYKRAWIDKDGEVWWLKDRFFRDQSVREVDYSYEIDEDSLLYEPDGIMRLAQDLITEYAGNRRALKDTETDRPIIWVCHDLGGAIVKEALTLAINSPAKYGKIAILTTVIIFMGTPHRFESIDSSWDQLHQLVLLPGPEITKNVSNKVRELSRQVINVHEAFLSTKMFDRATIFNLFSLHTRRAEKGEPAPIYAMDGSVRNTNFKDVDSEEAWYLNAIAPFPRHAYLTGHSFESFGRHRFNEYHHAEFVSPSLDDGRLLTSAQDTFNRPGCPIDVRYDLITYQAWLLSLSPPTRSLDTPFDPMLAPPVVEWIREQQPFRAFSAPGGAGPRLLHMHENGYPFRNDIREVSRLFYLSYDTDVVVLEPARRTPEQTVIYFEFDQTDSRYNNISSLLTYIINSIVCRFWRGYESDISHELKFMKDSCACSLEDLYRLYTALRARNPALRHLTIFLSCFDQCASQDERSWFLQRVLQQHSYCEAEDRLILSTWTRDGLGIGGDSFPNGARINLEDHYRLHSLTAGPSTDEPAAYEIQAALEKLITTRPVYAALRPQLEILLGEYTTSVPHLQPILINFLTQGNRGDSRQVLADRFSKLSPATATSIIQAVHSSLKSECRFSFENAFNLVKHAAEPWSPESLREALTIIKMAGDSDLNEVLEQLPIDDFEREDTISLIQQLSCGILVVTGRDVKFGHPSFYDGPDLGFNASEEESVPLTVEEQAARINGTIAATCLRYLQTATAARGQRPLEWLSPDNFEGGPWSSTRDAVVIAQPRTSMGEYAVRFWPHHYRASGRFKPSQLVRQLFATPSTRATWETPFYLLSNPFTRIHRSYISPLPVFAMLGMEDLVEEELQEAASKQGRDKTLFEKTCWYAITEAARVANETIFWRLLKEATTVHEEELEQTLFWAAASGNVKILNAVIAKIPHLNAFPWPLGGNIVSRAAAAGLDDLLVAMRLSGHDMEKAGDYWGATPIMVAIWHDRVSTVELLLRKSELDLDLDAIADNTGDTPLNNAAQKGNPHVLEILLQGGVQISVNGKDDENKGAVQAAAEKGNHKALEMLLSAGADLQNDSTNEEISDDLRPSLISAADYGFQECARVLLKHGADPNVECRTGTALYYAVSGGHLDVVRLLFGNEAYRLDVNSLDKVPQDGGEMLSLRAVSTGNADLVSLLIEQGVMTVNSFDPASSQFTKAPLARACAEGHLAVVKLLLEGHKADVNYTGDEGSDTPSDTPLLATIYEFKMDVLDYLVETQLDHMDANWAAASDGIGPIHLAIRYPRLVATLLKMKRAPAIDSLSFLGTPLFMAAAAGNARVVEVLLQNDPKPDVDLVFDDKDAASSKAGHTALQYACKRLKTECVRLLLRAGASSTLKNRDGHDAVGIILVNTTPTAYQAELGDFKDAQECLRLLLVSEAYIRDRQVAMTINSSDSGVVSKDQEQQGQERQKQQQSQPQRWRTRLHSIRKNTPVSLVKVLVEEARAPLDIQDDEDGHTPLSLAVKWGNEPVARYLITRGANVNVFAPAFGSILHIAVANADISMARLLVASGADIDAVDRDFGESLLYTALSRVTLAEMPKMVRYLVDEVKVSVDKMGGPLRYPIIRAAYIATMPGLPHQLSTAMIKFLVRRGAAVDVSDSEGRRATHLAAASYWDDGLRALVGAGATIDVRDRLGRTPLHFAAASLYSDCLVYLLNLDEPRAKEAVEASIGAVDHDGWTPLMWAARSGDLENIPMLAKLAATDVIWTRSTAQHRAGEWSALKLLKFAGRDSPHLVDPRNTWSEADARWNDTFDESRVGVKHPPDSRCESCFSIIIGTIWRCIQCEKLEKGPVSLCFKCHSQLPDTHYSPDHNFDEVGPMYAVLERSHSSASSGSNASNNGEGGQEETTTRRGARQDSEEGRSEREGKVGEADFAAGRERPWVDPEDNDEDDDSGENDDDDDDDDDDEEESLGSAIVHESSDEESWLQ